MKGRGIDPEQQPSGDEFTQLRNGHRDDISVIGPGEFSSPQVGVDLIRRTGDRQYRRVQLVLDELLARVARP